MGKSSLVNMMQEQSKGHTSKGRRCLISSARQRPCYGRRAKSAAEEKGGGRNLQQTHHEEGEWHRATSDVDHKKP